MICCNVCGALLEGDEEGFYYCPECDTETYFSAESE